MHRFKEPSCPAMCTNIQAGSEKHCMPYTASVCLTTLLLFNTIPEEGFKAETLLLTLFSIVPLH